MSRPTRIIQATWIAMIALQTIGSVDSKRKLPAPRQYVAIGAVWGILFMLADTGLGKVAARLSLLVLLTASVLGPFGKRFVTLAVGISQLFAVQPQPQNVSQSGQPSASNQPRFV